MNNTVLITGAYGFIGRYTALEYKRQGYFVIGMGHGDWSKDEYTQWGIDKWHCCDISLKNLKVYIKQPEVIVHCAGSGSVGYSIEHPMQDFERTVQTIQAVLEYIRLYSKDTKLIYPSSAAVYGNLDCLPIKEESLLKPISPYGVHKKIAEEICTMYCQEYNVCAIIVRLFSVYGNGLKKQLLWDACNKIKDNKVIFWGTGDETRDWVHVTDVANLLYMAKEKADKNCPIVNCGSGENISIKKVLTILFYCFRQFQKPKFNGEINIGNPCDYLADDCKIISWGWQPKIKLEDGIKKYAEWYKNNEKD